MSSNRTSSETDDGNIVDELPADHNLEEFTGDYLLPNNNRRRVPAAMYLVLSVGCIASWVLWRDESAFVNNGVLWAGILLGAFALFGLVAGITLRGDESQALVTATKQVGFPVGHASAQMVWRGLLSRPVWRLLVYSADTPPKQRGFVIVDAVSGAVIEWFAENNPEEWAASSDARGAEAGSASSG